MTTDEIRPKQLRALLLLLFLVPLIPTAMMARFMVDALRGERSMAAERLEQRYAAGLGSALATAEGGNAEEILARMRDYTDANVTQRIVGEKGAHIAGERNPWGPPLAQSAVPGHPGWMAIIHMKDDTLLEQSVEDQRRLFVWTLGLTGTGVICIAGLAVLALRRQLALQELKNTSVATVAHELRTPLASMRMLVDTLREGRYRGEDKLREYLDLIAAENERLGRLSESFLTFSRLEKGGQAMHFEVAPPADIAHAAVRQMQGRLTAPACNFTAVLSGTLPNVRVDRDAIISALCNMLDNALKYTGDEKRIVLRADAKNGGVSFFVEDNGVGVPEDQRRAIFRPFYQADQRLSRTREGCGLGLSIVQRIVDAHRGKISLESAPGGGAIFELWLPGISP